MTNKQMPAWIHSPYEPAEEEEDSEVDEELPPLID